ncbi:MAG: ABC transporter substrate-binding protein [Burkholderiales bacterium]|jgi:iron complex transport system substrate-binding protein|nr:ABC transporter substrate-binding protein [Burkholderiales bacterium]
MARSFFVAFLLTFLGIISGCGEQQGEAQQNTDTLSQNNTIIVAVPTREIVDMAGRTVRLRQEINRIGTLGSVPMMNTFVESLGAGKKIYNQPSKFHDIHGRWKMHLEFAPQLVNGPHFQSSSHELLIENILAADPDVCITNSKSILDVLDKVGVPTVFVDWSTVDRMMDSVTMLGEVLREQERAAAYIRYFQDTKDRLKALSESIPILERRTVLYSNPTQFRCPGSLTEEWLVIVGALSVTREAYLAGRREYDLEELLKWDPEIIFLTYHKTVEELKINPAYKDISAVKNNSIILAPTVGHMWGGHTVEAPIAAYWMMYKLYPKLMTKEQLVKEIKYFYKTFFAYEMSDKQIDEIIAGGRGV